MWIVDKEYLDRLINQNKPEDFPWEIYDSIAIKENLKTIEDFVINNARKKDVGILSNRYYLNLFYCLGKIGNSTTINKLVKIIAENTYQKELVLEILDAIGNIVSHKGNIYDRELNKILNEVLRSYNSFEFLSSVDYIKKGLAKSA